MNEQNKENMQRINSETNKQFEEYDYSKEEGRDLEKKVRGLMKKNRRGSQGKINFWYCKILFCCMKIQRYEIKSHSVGKEYPTLINPSQLHRQLPFLTINKNLSPILKFHLQNFSTFPSLLQLSFIKLLIVPQPIYIPTLNANEIVIISESVWY